MRGKEHNVLDTLEMEAIHRILETLEALSPASQDKVVIYLLGRLGAPMVDRGSIRREDGSPDEKKPQSVKDIRTLKEQKDPKTTVEMAALVGYYLQELAPESDRKKEIRREDLEKYFKQADYPLPTGIANTLPQAKDAGYFEQAATGRYRLNAVGHNLVVHNLPSPGGKRAKTRGAKSVKKQGPPKRKPAARKRQPKA